MLARWTVCFTISILLSISSFKVRLQAGLGQSEDPHGLSELLGTERLAPSSLSGVCRLCTPLLTGIRNCCWSSLFLRIHHRSYVPLEISYWACMQGLLTAGYLAPGHPYIPLFDFISGHLSADALYIVSRLVLYGQRTPVSFAEHGVIYCISWLHPGICAVSPSILARLAGMSAVGLQSMCQQPIAPFTVTQRPKLSTSSMLSSGALGLPAVCCSFASGRL